MTIYKYPIVITDEQTISLPIGYKILSIQLQNNTICIWALVNPQNMQTLLRLRIFGTGYTIDNIDNLEFLASVQERMFVWHIFREN